jgi:hypothetical protein
VLRVSLALYLINSRVYWVCDDPVVRAIGKGLAECRYAFLGEYPYFVGVLQEFGGSPNLEKGIKRDTKYLV